MEIVGISLIAADVERVHAEAAGRRPLPARAWARLDRFPPWLREKLHYFIFGLALTPPPQQVEVGVADSAATLDAASAITATSAPSSMEDGNSGHGKGASKAQRS